MPPLARHEDWTHADPLTGVSEPRPYFRNPYYFRLNARRFEHLVALRLPLRGCSVLEVGAGIGDHTPFFLDRGCTVTVTEGRPENLAELRARFAGEPRVVVEPLDLDALPATAAPAHDLVYCYGVLYHLADPGRALDWLAPAARKMLLLETVVGFEQGDGANPVVESTARMSQSLRGTGCRPTRDWVRNRLRKHFTHVYVARKQPHHNEFLTDWSRPPVGRVAQGRAVFVASRSALDSPGLTKELPLLQERH